MRPRFLAVATLGAALACAPAPAAGRAGAVATEHRFAADAGAATLAAGGSTVDAAIAAAAALCVVHPSSCGIGGGGFALVHEGSGHDAALDYRETAPARATPDRFLGADGRPDPVRTRTGGLAVAVPGEVAGWAALHARFGRLPLATVLAPAIRLARDGFALRDVPHLRAQIARSRELVRANPGLAAIFLDAGGDVPAPEARIVQADLARTLERIGRDGVRAFVALAPTIAATVRARGGVLDAADVRAYRPRWLEPLTGSYRGRRLVTFPSPGSGAVVLEMLGILAEDPLERLEPGAALHLVAGAMAQGFADRAAWFGDVRVPVHTLLDPARLRALRARIPPDRVGEPRADLVVDAGTGHVSVVDAAGNAVAMTTTINTTFGAGILVPGTGIVLNDEMDDFALPGRKNAYGLTGGAANAIAPGKRPQSSMCPTVVLDGTRPVLVVGGSGGPLIISGVVQTILGVVAWKRDLRAAVDAPRIHDQATPPTLAVELALPADTRRALERIGHRLVDLPLAGAVAAVGLAEDGTPVAAGDRRKDGGEASSRR